MDEEKTVRLSVPKLVGIGVAIAAVAVACTLLLMPHASTTTGSVQSSPVSADATRAIVPHVVGLEYQDAEQAITNAMLDVGKKTEEYSDTVTEGHVISQDPAAGNDVEVQSKVNLVISKGKKNPNVASMPNIIGKTRQEAEQALRDAKLVPIQDTMVVTTDVAPGLVCRQSIKQGTKVKEGTLVSYALALSPKDDRVAVPNLAGLSLNDAKAALKKVGLHVDTTYVYSSSVAKDHVVKQSIKAGDKVAKGTVVTLTISLGGKPQGPIEVPNVVGKKADEATSAIQKVGLKADSTNEYSSTVAKGKVIRQSIPAGTKVAKDTKVTITVSMGAKPAGPVAVPDVSGMRAEDANNAIKNAGLTPVRNETYSDEVEKDYVIGQSIEAGTKVAKGTQVTFTVSLGKRPEPPVVKVAVPDIMTYTRDEAIEAIQSAGLVERWSGEEYGTVVSQDPPAGTEVEVGSIVTFTLDAAPTKIEVPDVEGMTADDASRTLGEKGLVLNYDSSRGGDILSDTDPVAGSLVDEGDTIEAVFQDNPEPEPQPEPEPEPQPEPQPESQPEPEPQPEAEPQPEQAPENQDNQNGDNQDNNTENADNTGNDSSSNGTDDAQSTGSKPNDDDITIFNEAMSKSGDTGYELISKLSVAPSNDGTDYTFLCRGSDGNYTLVIHESGVDSSTATLISATKA